MVEREQSVVPTDWSDSKQWRVADNGNLWVETDGYFACIHRGKKGMKFDFGGFIKTQQGGANYDEKPLVQFWANSVRELFLELELARRKLREQR